MQSVPITTNIVSLNPVHGNTHSIHYVIKFVSDIVAGRWFSPGTLVFSTNKTDSHDITEILLKVALNTINQTNQSDSDKSFPRNARPKRDSLWRGIWVKNKINSYV
jgi:hypothetical protein